MVHGVVSINTCADSVACGAVLCWENFSRNNESSSVGSKIEEKLCKAIDNDE